MIKFENVNFSYDKKNVLKDFNLEIKKGDRICFTGPSGIGKTTLLRLILSLEKTNSGKLQIADGTTFSAVFQEDRLLPFKTVKENVEIFDDTRKGETHLKALGLEKEMESYPSSLSGGMARRVAIARALSRDAQVYLFDEIFNGLDQPNIEKTAQYILSQIGDKTIIMVSHNREHAALLGCKIIDLN